MPNNIETKSVNKINKGSSIINFFHGLKVELKRVTWPSYEKIKKSTIVALIFCLMFVVITGLLDYGFQKLFDLVFLKK